MGLQQLYHVPWEVPLLAVQPPESKWIVENPKIIICIVVLVIVSAPSPPSSLQSKPAS